MWVQMIYLVIKNHDIVKKRDIANVIMQLAKSVKTDANKVAVSRILPGKDKFNSKAKEVNTHFQDICSSNINCSSNVLHY